MADAQTPPGWYPDTQTPGQQRYWDGSAWTENVAPLAAQPYIAPAKKGHGCLYAVLGVAGVVIVGVVILVAALGTAAKKVTNDINKTRADAMKEVKITSCRADALGDVTIKGTADNTTSGRSNFLIEVVVESKSGTQLDSTATGASNVESHQTAVWEAPSTAKFAPGVTCKVASVIRTASLNP